MKTRADLQRDPSDLLSHIVLGTVLLESGRLTEAYPEFVEVLRLDSVICPVGEAGERTLKGSGGIMSTFAREHINLLQKEAVAIGKVLYDESYGGMSDPLGTGAVSLLRNQNVKRRSQILHASVVLSQAENDEKTETNIDDKVLKKKIHAALGEVVFEVHVEDKSRLLPLLEKVQPRRSRS